MVWAVSGMLPVLLNNLFSVPLFQLFYAVDFRCSVHGDVALYSLIDVSDYGTLKT